MKWYQVVLRYYVSRIKEEAAKDNESFGVLNYSRMRGHLKWMCEEALKMDDVEKACTWLGFIQGAFAVMGEYTIDEMRMHNKNAKNNLALDTPI